MAAGVQMAHSGADFVWQRRRLRIALLALLIAVPLLGCGWLWLRQSPFVSVQRVQISGVHGPEAAAVQSALTDAARGMSTLDVHTGALFAAVAALRVVREVRAVPRFPHGLRIEVVEQLPVAALLAGGVRTAVAADGVVLGPALLSGSLPSVTGTVELAAGKRVSDATLLGALAVLGAAPAPLARLTERAFTGSHGLTVAMRNGLLVYFGDATRPHAKWLSLARVLADPSSAGASYVDVRLPSRPAAGFPPGVNPPSSSATASAESTGAQGSSESAVASLAAGLSSGSGAASKSGAEAPSSGTGASGVSAAGGESTSGEAGAEATPGESSGGATEPSPTATTPGG
ncbi:MAG: Cell division septal protein-like protein [Solirubrobacterales bacterium]|nr:Cell division septal protein-like protein [Solirubrobacterales bacterium]